MDALGLSTGELFALLVLGMGPTRVSLAFIPVAATLSRADQRQVAVRTTLTGFVIVVLLTVAGEGVVRSYTPRIESILISSGLVLIVVTLASLLRRPIVGQPAVGAGVDVKSWAISPLTVPTMINPAGVALLFAASMYLSGTGETLTFLGLAFGLLVADFLMLLIVPRLSRVFIGPVLRVLQEVFSLLTVSLGVRMILNGLDGFGVIDVS